MIEDEEKDIEERLKSNITWKSALKTVLIFVMILGAFLLINFASGEEGLGGSSTFLGFMLLCIASSLMAPSEKQTKDVRQTLTKLKCRKCNTIVVRDYSEGDYLYKEGANCPNCDNLLKIQEIYSVKLTQDEDKRKKPVTEKPGKLKKSK
ncbi:MAG: hypothetical protein GF364_05265 [Candidatus Lokiarchaeota archaeon]|nr:hypothetical protein [Candidatus Lokiarchaeota archaeon]